MATCSVATETPLTLQILNATGHVLYATAAKGVYAMSWGGLSGTFPVVAANDTTVGGGLCESGDMAWAGKVVLAGGFYGPGCSFETRARMSNNAAGLLFSGSLHNAFDWDGSAHVDLMPSSVANVAVYECAKDAIMSAGGDATIELTSTQTPLLDTGFQILSWLLAAPMLIMMCVNVGAAAWQIYRFHGKSTDASTRAVIILEALSQLMLFVRQLNGPGFDLGWRSLVPHPVYRLSMSLFQDFHMAAMLLVSRQLRGTIIQINNRKQLDADRGFCARYFDTIITIVASMFILLDLVVAIMDGAYAFEHSFFVQLALGLNTLFMGGMGIYYLRAGGKINRMIQRTTMFGSNKRVAKFSQNVRRVGFLLIATFCFSVGTFLAVTFLDDQSNPEPNLAYYIAGTIIFPIGIVCELCQSFCMILSYVPPADTRPKARDSATMYGSSADLSEAIEQHAAASQRASGDERASDMASIREDSAQASPGNPRNPNRPPKRGSSLKRAASSFKGLEGLSGSKFNLFDDLPNGQPAPIQARTEVQVEMTQEDKV